MPTPSAGSSSRPLSSTSIGERVSPAILENTNAVHEEQATALTGVHAQQMEVAQATIHLDNKIERVHENTKKLVDHINRNDARRKAQLNWHDRILTETQDKVDQHDDLHDESQRKAEQHTQNLDEYGSRLDSLERSHQWWIPAAWSIGTTVVCGLLVWGFTKFLGKKKKEDRTQEPKEPSDEESDVEDAGIPVGRKRPVGNQRRGRRPHARAWRVAPELRSEWRSI